ncbi:MAG: 3-dehydroquinate synthase II [Planctomycetes bacterium]|nr:3-dehydroquinate synthase II [Planctomycetota bacterium]
MKKVWVQVDPWRKELVTAALEAGADAVVLPAGCSEQAKALGRIATVAPDGDIRLGADAVRIEVASKADEERAARCPAKTVILQLRDWTVIPLENLVAQRGGIMVEVSRAEDARLVTQILEKGADGIVLVSSDPAEVKRACAAVREHAETLTLVPATVTRVQLLGMGDRVCLDTCTEMKPGEGMLVGDASSAFFLVHSESIETPYVATRPFRVNAGAVHAYVLCPEGKTRYLDELRGGDPCLIVRHDGAAQVAYLGRSKVERRPMLRVEAEAGGQTVSLVLQNAETIRLTRPDGSAISVALLKPGDQVLAHLTEGGRHFGMAVKETLTER